MLFKIDSNRLKIDYKSFLRGAATHYGGMATLIVVANYWGSCYGSTYVWVWGREIVFYAFCLLHGYTHKARSYDY